jgi:hypothetical protein
VKKYKGVPSRLATLSAEQKTLRTEWNARTVAKAAAARA